MVSVSGLRGIVGRSLTPPLAARYGAAFGSWLRETTGEESPLVVVGRDSRPSGPMVEHAAVAGLIATGCRVVTIGVAATPTTAVMVEHLHAHGGMVITASHNPIEWNGIKTLRHDGIAPPLAPPPEQAEKIIARFRDDRIDYAAVEQLRPTAHDDSANAVHIARILARIDAEAIRRRRPKVVLDSVCGAGGPATAALLHELGVELVHLHGEPTGRFPHIPEPTAENLTGLCDAVREHGADLGFAQDPDADRLAIVDETGRYIGEEYTLALCAMRVLERCEPSNRAVAANLSTSRMIDDVAARFGAAVHRTPVGEANVADAMRRTGAIAGGEGNGGIIWPEVVMVRDSLAGIALVLELLATSNQHLSELVRDIPAYAIVKRKLPIREGLAERAIERLAERFTGEKIDRQDGIRIDLAAGWIHVRPSNTEPILRIIAEAADEPAALRLIDQASGCIETG